MLVVNPIRMNTPMENSSDEKLKTLGKLFYDSLGPISKNCIDHKSVDLRLFYSESLGKMVGITLAVGSPSKPRLSWVLDLNIDPDVMVKLAGTVDRLILTLASYEPSLSAYLLKDDGA